MKSEPEFTNVTRWNDLVCLASLKEIHPRNSGTVIQGVIDLIREHGRDESRSSIHAENA
jgi:hypothetical protein